MLFTLKHSDILNGNAQVHLARATLTPTRPKALHDHDFFELFWVQNGKVRHHLQDRAETLTEGDLIFMRPGQPHALQGRGEHALIVSISIHPGTIKALVKRHPGLCGHLFWAKGPIAQTHRNIRQLAALNHAAVQLEQSDCGSLAAEGFLLPLCAELTADNFPPDMPGWLTEACRAAKDPATFRDGAAGLVALTGKAHPHVSRMMRKHLGITPSDYVNQQRMAFAARALITDAEPVGQIAADCGLPNMSHFHKLFRAAYGHTPLQYRQKYQRQIIQPV
ncbi:helix-turn-helix transcriptional regulator [Yoonia sediminilitoris]|uniref:AraC family transcriptional regulator n=1 Tax=Yoonia sediminilitoris TaxID=1286148 RepID=A0A2T6KFR1_9RHOB|nr:helix-turn-helix domain-containing protein [Yoonia sediminilitoris]PUB14134.1 AraC family transcriptional regulator [Yoonia sediminilitoris]RCW95065.1 AraC family transcriptional regulator [Yoonia sediminilitoris]